MATSSEEVARALEAMGIDPDPHHCVACGRRLRAEHWPREHLRCPTHGTVGIGIHHYRDGLGPHCACWMHAEPLRGAF